LCREEKEEVKSIVPLNESADPFHKLEKLFVTKSLRYTFVLKTKKQRFAKGSQIYLNYGKLSNREALLHYGFVLEKNKYNYTYFRMSFSDKIIDPKKIQLVDEVFKNSSSKDMLAKGFRVRYHKFNECKRFNILCSCTKVYEDINL